MKKWNKATASAVSGALVTVLAAVTDLDAEAIAAIGTLVTTALVFWIPNKPA